MEVMHTTDLKFNDITSELWREYDYGNGIVVHLINPIAVAIAPSGSHRVLTEDGVSHRVSPGFVDLRWKAKDGHPHFVF